MPLISLRNVLPPRGKRHELAETVRLRMLKSTGRDEKPTLSDRSRFGQKSFGQNQANKVSDSLKQSSPRNQMGQSSSRT